mmetsp:Transcript_36402/g.108174  ORF Transcript_36402/g.108174 Transcript_36402/m.108174 type:complete len:227 (-) Transcript_36402:1880-2560(-)
MENALERHRHHRRTGPGAVLPPPQEPRLLFRLHGRDHLADARVQPVRELRPGQRSESHAHHGREPGRRHVHRPLPRRPLRHRRMPGNGPQEPDADLRVARLLLHLHLRGLRGLLPLPRPPEGRHRERGRHDHREGVRGGDRQAAADDQGPRGVLAAAEGAPREPDAGAPQPVEGAEAPGSQQGLRGDACARLWREARRHQEPPGAATEAGGPELRQAARRQERQEN